MKKSLLFIIFKKYILNYTLNSTKNQQEMEKNGKFGNICLKIFKMFIIKLKEYGDE